MAACRFPKFSIQAFSVCRLPAALSERWHLSTEHPRESPPQFSTETTARKRTNKDHEICFLIISKKNPFTSTVLLAMNRFIKVEHIWSQITRRSVRKATDRRSTTDQEWSHMNQNASIRSLIGSGLH